MCDSSIFFLFHQLIVSLPLADQALLSATLDVPSTYFAYWSVSVSRSSPLMLHLMTTVAGLSVHLSPLPPVAPLCPEQGRALPLQPSLIWSTVNRNSSQLDMPFSGFTCSFSFSLAFCFFDYFGQDHFVPELESPFHPEGTHFLLPFGNIWVLKAEGVRLCFSDLKNPMSFLYPFPSSLSLLSSSLPSLSFAFRQMCSIILFMLLVCWPAYVPPFI